MGSGLKIAVLSVLCGIGVGFILGRSVRTITTKIEYIREQPLSGVVHNVSPVIEERPNASDLPLRRDTIYIKNTVYVSEVIDTAAIIAEYELRRTYKLPVFDNTYGKLDITVKTQYNRLDSLSYTFIPIRTVRTVLIERKWQPFVSLSYSTIGCVGAGGGIFYNKFGLEYQYHRILTNDRAGHQFGLKWKF